jgi:hypothetical protein
MRAAVAVLLLALAALCAVYYATRVAPAAAPADAPGPTSAPALAAGPTLAPVVAGVDVRAALLVALAVAALGLVALAARRRFRAPEPLDPFASGADIVFPLDPAHALTAEAVVNTKRETVEKQLGQVGAANDLFSAGRLDDLATIVAQGAKRRAAILAARDSRPQPKRANLSEWPAARENAGS